MTCNGLEERWVPHSFYLERKDIGKHWMYLFVCSDHHMHPIPQGSRMPLFLSRVYGFRTHMLWETLPIPEWKRKYESSGYCFL